MIRTTHAPVCTSDVHTVGGALGERHDLSLGHEAVGRGFIVAPELVVIESLNILRRLERAGQVTELEASTAQWDLQELEIELVSVRPFEDRIWQLRHDLTCYDAWYVSVAEAFDLPLATLDHRLARSTGPKCEFCTS